MPATMPAAMFASLDATSDNAARRRWSALASFTIQIIGLSLLATISMLWVERPPRVRWLQLGAPAAFTPEAETHALRERHSTATVSNRAQFIAPPPIPRQIAPVAPANSDVSSDSAPAAPDLPGIAGSSRKAGAEVAHGIGDGIAVAIPPRPVLVKPLRISHLAEANVLHRVQPTYPPIARLARVQGPVELRAIISKTGTIENLVVVRGHPMLASAALEAVRQWRYRPYLLNNEPVEVETEITVNFILSGG